MLLYSVLSLLILLDTFTVTIIAEAIHDYSKVLLEDADKLDDVGSDIENSLYIEKDGIIFNETQESHAPHNWDSLPLRVPPDLKDHLSKWVKPKSVRTGRQEEPIVQNPSPQVQGSFANPPIIAPGVYSCGHQGSDMFVNVINPRYPGHDTGAGTCHFRLVKHKPEICQIRVDFVDTEMLSPEDGNCDDQYMTVSGSIWPAGFKRLCGINPDQHFYIQLDNKATFQHIDITITTIRSNKPYKFGLWITQINCEDGSAVQSPPGCTQYYFGSEGIIKTFNFEGVQYLGSQNYKVCIRSERGACFVGFAADANHFMLQLHPSDNNVRFRNNNNRNSARPPAGRGDEDCTTDFLLIPGGRGNITRYGPTYDRYCGGQLNTESTKDESAPVYSEITSPVIWLQFVTGPRESHILSELKRLKKENGNNGNNLNDKYDGTGPGFRLRYSQLNNCVHQSFFGN